MNLEDVLGKIQTDRLTCMWTASSFVIRLRRSLYGTSMPGAGAVHGIRFVTIEDSRDDDRSDPPR
jgi:hypothetical protein